MIRLVLVATAALCAMVAFSVYLLVRMSLAPTVGVEVASRALTSVRGALVDRDAQPSFEANEPQRWPVIITLYDHGKPAARGVGHGDTFGAAVRDATQHLREAHVDAVVLSRGRLKLDRVVGRGFLSSRVLPLLALGAVPGIDGIGVEDHGASLLLTSDDLVRERLWSGYQPVPALEFSLGIDVARLLRTMSLTLGRSPRWRPEHVFRFRAEEYLEAASGAVPILAGHPPGLPVNRQTLADGARAGGAYLLKHLDAVGRFDYEYYLVEDSSVVAGYSIPRHAGASSFLAQLYALDHDPAILSGVRRALDALTQMHPPGCDGARACVGEVGDALVDLGSSALSLVAVTEYQRTTGDARYAAFARGLAEFVLYMQKADGDFCHLYTPRPAARDEKTQLLYYSGEAAYGLARLLALGAANPAPELTSRVETALDRALHYLTHDAYDTFAGQFYIGEDHWTCMAVDAGWDHLPPAHREKYARFCDDFSRFLRRSQFRRGESLVAAQPQLEGGYGLSAVLAPHSTPVGSRSETTISMWRIARRRGLAPDDPRVTEPREQVMDGMRFLLARQLRTIGTYLAANPEAAVGGIPMSDVEPYVRIDFIQHSCSAMLRALEML